MMTLNIYFDGASRGNPGIAGAGALLQFSDQTIPLQQFLGVQTNNYAEYRAVILGLTYVTDHMDLSRIETINVFGDSLLVINQLSGEWKVKSDNLRDVYQQGKSLLDRLRAHGIKVRLHHIPRGKNEQADILANEAIKQR